MTPDLDPKPKKKKDQLQKNNKTMRKIMKLNHCLVILKNFFQFKKKEKRKCLIPKHYDSANYHVNSKELQKAIQAFWYFFLLFIKHILPISSFVTVFVICEVQSIIHDSKPDKRADKNECLHINIQQ